jgi:CRISPR-associated protein Cmr4
MKSRIMTLYAETSLHPGTGQTAGVVDLPIQRERHTGFPKIEASGLKGSLRSVAEQQWPAQAVTAIFGPETARASDHAGALAPTDARILAFPVRALTEVFVWVTCPKVVERLRRDIALGGVTGCTLPERDELKPNKEEAWVAHGSPFNDTEKLVLEELSFTVKKDADGNGPVGKLATKLAELLPAGLDRIQTHLVVLTDNDFAYLVQHATQVAARIVLSEKKTSENLWSEETLPPETIMYSLLMATDPRDGKKAGLDDAEAVLTKVADLFADRSYLQVGGNETVGQGWCAVKLTGGAS